MTTKTNAITTLINAIKAGSGAQFTVARAIVKAWKVEDNGQRSKATWTDKIEPRLAKAGADFAYDAARQAVTVGEYFPTDDKLLPGLTSYSYYKIACNSLENAPEVRNVLTGYLASVPKGESPTVRAMTAHIKDHNASKGTSGKGGRKASASKSTGVVAVTELLATMSVDPHLKSATVPELEEFVRRLGIITRTTERHVVSRLKAGNVQRIAKVKVTASTNGNANGDKATTGKGSQPKSLRGTK